MPENHDKKAKHVKATWGRRCNVLIFMSSKEGTIFKKIRLNYFPKQIFFFHEFEFYLGTSKCPYEALNLRADQAVIKAMAGKTIVHL